MKTGLSTLLVAGSVLCVGGCSKSPTAPSSTTITGVLSVTGSVAQITAPSDVRIDALQSDANTRLFNEVQGVTLSSALTVDYNVPGTYSAEPSPPLPVIAAGTVVNSYYLVADPTNPPATGVFYIGSITFDRNVLGLIVLNAEQAASNTILGRPGTSYASAGVQLDFPGDSVTLSADRRTVTFTLAALNAADNIRIVTER